MTVSVESPTAAPLGEQPQDDPRLVVLIPAFNEAETIEQAIARLPDSIAGITDIRVIVIDDGSTDDTAGRAADAGAHVVRHGRNLGLASAFRTAIQSALAHHASIAVTMDADLQFSADDLDGLVRPIVEGRADFVAGDRFSSARRPRHMPRAKYIGNHLMTYLVNRLSGGDFKDVSSGYRAYSTDALLNLNVQSSFTYTQETFIELAAKGLRIEQVPVKVTYYPQRRSRVSAKLVRYTSRTLLTIARTTRDYAPLTIFSTAALLFGLPGIAIGLFVLGHFAITGAFTPYIFLAFAAAYLVTLSLGLFALALAADMLRGIRSNQERLLYFAKKQAYGFDEIRNANEK